ncbi:MAG: MBL fold metallo-hydrolase [Gammaproteobacteria bacterium]
MQSFSRRVMTIAAILIAPMALGQTDYDKVEIESTAVSGGVYMLTGAGGNIGVFTSEQGVFMIDDQFAPLTDKIKAAVSQLSDQPLRYLVNTHWHFDHTGGNENIGKGGVVIVAHDNVRKRMSRDEFIEAYKLDVPAAPAVALPVVTFNSQMTFHFGGETIHVHHSPHAHTDGDSFIYFENANAIHTGDLFFNKIYPFIDTGSGGGIQGMMQAVKNVLTIANDDTRIIPGHGPLATKADLQEYLVMLEAAHDRVNAALNTRLTVSQLVFQKPMKDFDEKWGKGFMSPEQFIRIVYSDLANK